MPGKPPKAWFDKCVKSVKAEGKIDDPSRLCGWVWHHRMSDEAKKKAVAAESRVGRATQQELVVSQILEYVRKSGRTTQAKVKKALGGIFADIDGWFRTFIGPDDRGYVTAPDSDGKISITPAGSDYLDSVMESQFNFTDEDILEMRVACESAAIDMLNKILSGEEIKDVVMEDVNVTMRSANKWDVYVDGKFMGIINASNQITARAKAAEKYNVGEAKLGDLFLQPIADPVSVDGDPAGWYVTVFRSAVDPSSKYTRTGPAQMKLDKMLHDAGLRKYKIVGSFGYDDLEVFLPGLGKKRISKVRTIARAIAAATPEPSKKVKDMYGGDKVTAIWHDVSPEGDLEPDTDFVVSIR